MAWHCARHRAAFINQSGSLGRIHSLIANCGDFAGRAFAGAWNPAIHVPVQENYPRMGVAEISKACLVWRFGNSRAKGDSQNRRDHPTQRQFTSCYFWAFWAVDAAANALLGRRSSRQ
jgi:hypothetical protein